MAVCHNISQQDMCIIINLQSVNYCKIYCQSTSDKLARHGIQEKIRDFDQSIKRLIGDFNDVKVRVQNIDEKFPFTDFLMNDEIQDNDNTSMLFQQIMENGEVFKMPHDDNDQFNDAVKREIREVNDAIGV